MSKVSYYSRIKNVFKQLEDLSRRFDAIDKKIKDFDKKNEFLFWVLAQKGNEDMLETKRRVFSQMPMATGELRYLQRGNAYILQKLKKLCREADVHIFPVGGTSLGAVRHQGFIPWDDDIDVGIFRHDFDKILSRIMTDNELEVKYYYCLQLGERFIKVKFKNLRKITIFF